MNIARIIKFDSIAVIVDRLKTYKEGNNVLSLVCVINSELYCGSDKKNTMDMIKKWWINITLGKAKNRLLKIEPRK